MYDTYGIEPWLFSTNLLRFDFLLILLFLRENVKNIIGNFLFKITIYILLNNFFDRFLGLIGWSWNDFLTVVLIVIEFLIHRIMKKHINN